MNDQIKNVAAESKMVCAGCLNHMNNEDYISALDHEWHTECFRCSACDAALSSWYFEKDGLLFCQADYWSRYGESCQYCSEIITGPVMVAGEHRFHPECFCCSSCRAFIGDGEAYALIERSKLYCGSCYKQVMQPLGRGRTAHSIRVIEVPPRDNSGKSHRIRLSTTPSNGGPITSDYSCRGVTIKELLCTIQSKITAVARSLLRTIVALCLQLSKYSMDISYGLMALHIGDRILEINGTPIKDQPISEIEHLICYSDTVLQLTIEHDPEATNSTGHIHQHPRNCSMIHNNNRAHHNETHITKHDKIEVQAKMQNAIEEAIKGALINEQSTNINDSASETATRLNENIDIPLCEEHDDDESVVHLIEIHSKSQVPDSLDVPSEIGQTCNNSERLFKRREGAAKGGRALRRRGHPTQSSLADKDRSSSMSRLLDTDPSNMQVESGVLCDLSRTRSFRVDAANPPRPPPRVFRATDLLQGELLGSGFFGQVYKVTHRDTNEIMVLKQLYRVDEDAQKNFLKEVAVLRSLSHTNVLRFIGVLYKDKKLHLVTEYVAGGTLREFLQDSSVPLAWSLRARLARDVAAGLAYLHRMNVIHRDLNSHNCLLREDKTVIVADFGLARIVQRTGATSSMERSRNSIGNGHGSIQRKKRYTVVGNPYWMAPEMMKGNVYDEKVDVFSFGIVLCEIIGRVNADPDYLPRSSDFGLNEKVFIEKFCYQCPEPFYRMAFLCCDLNPDSRPPFEVLQGWLESLAIYLSIQDSAPPDLLKDIIEFVAQSEDYMNCKEGQLSHCTLDPPNNKKLKTENACCRANSLSKSKSGNILNNVKKTKIDLDRKSEDSRWSYGLGPKCVSASHICQHERPVIKVTKLSRSQNVLSSNPSGYIVRTDGNCKTINITKVDDITKWLDPPKSPRAPDQPLIGILSEKKPSTNNLINPDCGDGQGKLSKVCEVSHSEFDKDDLPCFLRNQSVEELESNSKASLNVAPQTFCRHTSIPDNYSDERSTTPDSKLSTDSEDMVIQDEIKVKECHLKPPKETLKRSKPSEEIKLPYNKPDDKKNILQKPVGMTDKASMAKPLNNLARKLMSPKLSRLFSDGKHEPNKPTTKNKFFSSLHPNDATVRSSYKVRPADSELPITHYTNKALKDVTALKKVSPNSEQAKPNEPEYVNRTKCMTPIFKRHHMKSDDSSVPVGRFSYRDSRTSKSNTRWYADKLRPWEDVPEERVNVVLQNRFKNFGREESEIVTDNKFIPISRCNNLSNIPSLSSVLGHKFPVIKVTDVDKDDQLDGNIFDNLKQGGEIDSNPKKDIDLSISNSNYVSLANLRINCPSLSRTRESIVKRGIKKLEQSGSLKRKPQFDNGVNVDMPKTQFESTIL